MTDADQPRSHSEQTDPATLGETGARAERPDEPYPPEEPLGVDDPSILGDGRIARDDVETRATRERPEVGEDAGGGRDHVESHENAEDRS
jgi:hypothetical protein